MCSSPVRRFGHWLALLGLLATRLSAAPAVRFSHLSTEQGLSQANVQAVLKDRDGFIWIGTEEGLNRYDGYRFVVYKHRIGDDTSLTDDVIYSLFEDRAGRFWIGTATGLCRLEKNTGRFIPVKEIHDQVNGITEDHDGGIWVASGGSGLLKLAPGATEFRSYTPVATEPRGIASFMLTSVMCDSAGRIWVGTSNAGVELFDPVPGFADQFRHFHHTSGDPASIADDNVWSLAEDADGSIWVATYGGGLNRLDPRTGKFTAFRKASAATSGFPTDLTTSVAVDRNGTVWVGTDGGGLLRYDEQSGRFVPHPHSEGSAASLSSNVVRSIYEDHDGGLWIGTFQGGVNILNPPRAGFVHLSRGAAGEAAANDDPVTGFVRDENGAYWFGTETGWLTRVDQVTGDQTQYRFPSAVENSVPILALQTGRPGHLWAGTYRGGIADFDVKKEKFTVYRHDASAPDSLANDEVWAIGPGPGNQVWLATSNGLDLFDGDTGRVRKHWISELGHPELRALLVEPTGRVWTGGLGGLALLDPASGTATRFVHSESDPRSLSNNLVVSLWPAPGGAVWCGTIGGGLNLFDPASQSFRKFPGPPSSVVNAVVEDAEGSVWISSNRGISRIWPAQGTVQNFDQSNGLQSLRFHQNAGYRLPNGHVLFGCVDGYYDITPATIQPSRVMPKVVMTAIRVLNEPVGGAAPLSLPTRLALKPNDKILSLEFSALDYSMPRSTRYAYRLEGFSDQWTEIGGQHEVTFTNLDPGSYHFWIRATNSDGIWGQPTAAALDLEVEPALWQTWWCRALAVMAIFLLALAVHLWRLRQVNQLMAERQASAAAKEKLESHLAQARKMEALGTLAGGIAHDFNNILTAIIGNAQLAALDLEESSPLQVYLRNVLFASNRARDVVRQILTYSRKRASERKPTHLETVVREALDLLKASTPSSIEIRAILPSTSPSILADATQLHQILLNLVTNAIHAMESKGGVLTIRQETVVLDEEVVRLAPKLRRGRYVRLSVGDTGCGMDPATLARVFEPYFTTKGPEKGTGLGLAVVYGIVQAHEGDITVYSEVGKGTTFRVYFPVKDDESSKPAANPLRAGEGRGESIVVVDDDQIVLDVAMAILRRAGYQVTGFRDPAEALRALQQGPLDINLLVTDLTMPNLTGVELARAVRALHSDLPIILCTGFEGAAAAEDIARLKLIGPLLKPFTHESLTSAIAAALAR
ncbi:MAG TPA: two-component regulator propeller domain-containing protein [Candidatus Didemnitutus sp.]|nr:two-component regulator propeller domain-containing protein [Candidatus Didemnitutus sp.]